MKYLLVTAILLLVPFASQAEEVVDETASTAVAIDQCVDHKCHNSAYDRSRTDDVSGDIQKANYLLKQGEQVPILDPRAVKEKGQDI